MGSFLCPMMSGILAEQLGWEYPFYVIGVLGIAWFALWTLIVHEGPDSNPRYWWPIVQITSKKLQVQICTKNKNCEGFSLSSSFTVHFVLELQLSESR